MSSATITFLTFWFPGGGALRLELLELTKFFHPLASSLELKTWWYRKPFLVFTCSWALVKSFMIQHFPAMFMRPAYYHIHAPLSFGFGTKRRGDPASGCWNRRAGPGNQSLARLTGTPPCGSPSKADLGILSQSFNLKNFILLRFGLFPAKRFLRSSFSFLPDNMASTSAAE